MPTKLHKEIRWFREEIELCEQTIREVEADSRFGASKGKTLAKLRATLAVHREKLAELERQLPEESHESEGSSERRSAGSFRESDDQSRRRD